MLGHMFLANIAGEEFAITEEEAMKIAVAWVGLRRHYGGIGFDPKHQALFAFMAAVGYVELPRVRNRLARQKAEREQARVNSAAADLAGGGTVVALDPEGRMPGRQEGWPRPHG